eukprot:gene11155-7936_t
MVPLYRHHHEDGEEETYAETLGYHVWFIVKLGIMFGIDPISSDNEHSNAATGYAFTFDRPEIVKKFSPSSTPGLHQAYCLGNADKYDLRSGNLELEKDIIMQKGIGMVNFIRMIKQDSTAGSKNGFLQPWIAYNTAWLKCMHSMWKTVPVPPVGGHGDKLGTGDDGILGQGRVLIFQNEYYQFDDYCKDNKNKTKNKNNNKGKDKIIDAFTDIKKLM